MIINWNKATRVMECKYVEGDILCNVKKRVPHLDLDYQEFQNFNFV